MSNTLFNTPHANRLARAPVRSLIDIALSMYRMVDQHLRRARTDRILRSLSKEQLADIGIDSSVIRKGPQDLVDARLMNSLMSLR